MSTAPRHAAAVPKFNRLELEGALQEAACMADIAFTFIGVGLGFQNKEPPKLTEREATLVYWLMSQTADMIGLAEKAFHDRGEMDQ